MIENKNTIVVFVMVFIAIIVGIAFLTEAANTTNSLTELQLVSNESFTGNTSAAVTLDHGNLSALTELRNDTGLVLNAGNYTLDAEAGSILVVEYNGTYFVDYSWEGNSYLNDSSARSITRLVIVMFALAIMVIGLLAIFNPGFKEILGMGK